MRVGLLGSGAEAARTAEDSGLDSVWFSETLGGRGAWPLASAAAATTERIRIGVGVTNPYMLHPALFAMNYGALAELSGGRAVLTLGSTVRPLVEQVGLEHRWPRTSVREAIEIARALLAGEQVTYQGRAFSVTGLRLDFPVEHPAPVYMGAMGERSVRTAGAVADGWVASMLEPSGYVARARSWLAEGARDAGRALPEDFDVVAYLLFAPGEDGPRLRAEVKEVVGAMLAGQLRLYAGRPAVMRAAGGHFESVTPAEYGALLAALAAGAPAARAIGDDLIGELAVVGTPDECAATLRRYAEAGVTEAVLSPVGTGVAQAAAVIGAEIRPRVEVPAAAAR